MAELKRQIELLANVAVIVTSIVICATVLINRSQARDNASTSVPYKAGDKIENISGVDRNESNPTLLLVVRSSCHFCTESLPFYRRLLSQVSSRQLQTVGLVLEPESVGADYLQRNNVNVTKVVGLGEGMLPRVTVTPTLILINRNGTVVKSWIGKLRPDKEEEVIEAAKKAAL